MKKLYITLLALAFCLNGNGQIITTVAGNGTSSYTGDGGQATAAGIEPAFIAFDAVGNYYIAGDNSIRKVNTLGIISTVAGVGSQGFTGDGGQATAAELYLPYGVACDISGNIYIADTYNNRIRKVNTAGIITTIAGNGSIGFSGDGGQATNAELFYPEGLTFDVNGNLYIADVGNYRVRKISTAGIITLVAGNGGGFYGGDGGQATDAELYYPTGVTFDAAGNLYIADSDNYRVRKVNTSGIITTIAGNGTPGYSGDGGQATASEISGAAGIAFDTIGNLYIADSQNNRVRMVNTAGIITTIAGNGIQGYNGDGGQPTAAELNGPIGLIFDVAGNLYISDGGNGRVRLISPPLIVTVSPTVTTICAGATTTLTASGATSYTWSPSAGLNIDTGAVVIANPTVTTNYTVTGRTPFTALNLSNVPTSTAIATVTIAGITVNQTAVCLGDTVILTAAGASTCTWSSNAGSATTTTVAVAPTSNTTYTVNGSVAACTYTSTAITSITVNPVPSLTVSPAFSNICAGFVSNLVVSGATSYTWTPSGSLSSSTGSLVSASPMVSTIYTITGTSGNCTSTTTSTIIVAAAPTISITPFSNIICSGSSVVITPSGANTYTIFPGNIHGNSFTVSPTGNTTYTVFGTNTTTGCPSSSSNAGTTTVNVAPSPNVPALSGSISNPLSECIGTIPVTLIVTPSGSSVPVWYIGSTHIASGNTYTPATSSLGTSIYAVYDSSTVTGCTSAAAGNVLSLTVTVNPLPTVSYTLVADTAAPHTWDAYPTYPGGAITVVWSWGDGTTSNTLYPSHTYSAAGTYSICVTVTEGGCSTTYCQDDAVSRLGNNSPLSTLVYINVKSGTMGIEQITNSNDQVNIYPNPNNGSFVIEPSSATKQTMQLYNVNGKLVLTQTINGKTSIDASNLSEGVYNISIISKEGVINKRIVIVK